LRKQDEGKARNHPLGDHQPLYCGEIFTLRFLPATDKENHLKKKKKRAVHSTPYNKRAV
jgi:hypothetical protein